jgi:UDP-N-acetylmuramate--alanine ligase
MRQFGHRGAEYAGDAGKNMENGIEMIAEAAEPGDLVLTLGAGSVSQAADRILERLRAKAEASPA